MNALTYRRYLTQRALYFYQPVFTAQWKAGASVIKNRALSTSSVVARWSNEPAPLGTAMPLNQPTENLSWKERAALTMAKLLGYNRPSSLSIRASRDLYAACVQAADDKAFYVHACGLPDNFNTWFSITQLHVWMLMVRLRPETHGKAYAQELINRFFEDIEDRIRAHGIDQNSIINKMVKERLDAFRGGVLAYDEGMCKSDAVLAAAIWR
ncbi:ubiquinol-cytochrome C chaperone-domain-containing protein [Syncephalis fuscata]|nr:ubiquinol-cytochrome C chaperone-domain-containing protein [Syncephalis fuscata]